MIPALIACKRDKAPESVNPSPLIYELAYSREGDEFPRAAVVTGDSVFYCSSFSDAAFTKTDLAFGKTPSSGKGMLSYNIGLTNSDNDAARMQYMPDGSFMITGSTGNGSTNGMVLFVNKSGSFLRGYNFDNGGDETFADGSLLPDGSYLLAGTTNANGRGLRDVFLVKMNASGGLQWKKTLGTPGNDGASQLMKVSDGYFIYGYTDGAGAGDRDLLIIKISNNGDSLWSTTYGGAGYEQSGGIVATPDGNYILCGHTTSFGDPMHDAYLIKINEYGDELWHKTYGGADHDGLDAIIRLSNGDFAMIGYSRIYGLNDDELYYLQVTPNGSLRRELRYGYATHERGTALAEVSDGIILVGYSMPLLNQNSNIYLVKITK